jgi:sporulation related protein
LSERLTGVAPLGETMKRVSQIAHSVAALHAAGRRHGYLIPENLWVREDGRVAFLDAGIHAAAAHAAFSSGFPVAPCPYVPATEDAYVETNQGADVYSLVALLLRLITGQALPAGDLTAVVDTLPEILPASLRTELRDTVAIPRSSTAATARALGVHLAFDTAWIRAQERSQREQHLVEGELLTPNATPAGGRVGETGDDALARWARAQPTAGVRGGASAAIDRLSPVQGALARLADAGRSAVDAVRRRTAGERAPGQEATPLVASYAVRLGPFADSKTASAVRARVRQEWPTAEVVTAEGEAFVQVTTCANRQRAAELVDRLREGGDPAMVSAL